MYLTSSRCSSPSCTITTGIVGLDESLLHYFFISSVHSFSPKNLLSLFLIPSLFLSVIEGITPFLQALSGFSDFSLVQVTPFTLHHSAAGKEGSFIYPLSAQISLMNTKKCKTHLIFPLYPVHFVLSFSLIP